MSGVKVTINQIKVQEKGGFSEQERKLHDEINCVICVFVRVIKLDGENRKEQSQECTNIASFQSR